MDTPQTPGSQASPAEGKQTLQFQAEMKQLLDLFIRSLYSNKEVFLRELISNASDALDRLRFEALTQGALQSDAEPEIRLEVDPQARTLTVHDNGIGMSREEVIANIGTIARSGTRELMDRLREARSTEQTLQLIGQFGVGFYSSFMVAQQVTLVTRRAGAEEATLWESTGDGRYSVAPTTKGERGTTVTLHLRPVDDEDGLPDFTNEWVLSGIVKKYSDFVRYPVRMKVTREEVERDEEGKPKPDAPKKTVVEDRTLNSMKAIWARRPQEVTEEEYHDFYKHISHDWEKPLKTITVSAEGRLEYRALLFIPSRAPFDLHYAGSEAGLQLFAQSVKIVEKCQDLLPRYLRFVRGVVDSPDLSLNVSREMLQHDRQITQIRRGLVKKLLDVLGELQEKEPETYRTFWKELGRTLKEGVSADHDQKDKLVALLLFESSAEADKLTTVKEYVARMKPEQQEIYYLTGESRSLIDSSPHLEVFKTKGYEVLYLSDPIDELMMQSLSELEGKKLKSVGAGTVDLGSKEERERQEQERKTQEEGYAPLFKVMQQRLDAQVKEIRLSSRLTTSPVCLVGEGLSPRLQRLLGGQRSAMQRRTLELNPGHAILKLLAERFERDQNDARVGDYAELLLGQALLAEGAELPDPVRFSQLVAELMVRAGS
jgi:molecular chaperone HtpG